MSITSRFYYKNVLKRAEDGLGDGTKYATASSATVDQENKTFTLSGFSIVPDSGSDSLDKFNSYILYFPSSGNKYHIVDWEPTNDRATTWETPSAEDTGACEIRATLVAYNTGDVNADYPPLNLADGKRSTVTKMLAANDHFAFEVFLPNFIEDGGFEQQSVGAPSSPWGRDGTDWTISSTSPLLGSRMAVYSKGSTNTDLYVADYLPGTLEKGKTYKLVFKAKALTANPPGDTLQINLQQRPAPSDLIDSSNNGYKPALTTTAQWFSTEYTPDFTTDKAYLLLWGLGSTGSWGSCTGFQVDELYLFEKIQADRLIVFNHNWNGAVYSSGDGYSTIVRGMFCNPRRSSFAWGDDTSGLLTYFTQNGTEPIVKTLLSDNGHPIYWIVCNAKSWLNYEAGEIFIGRSMVFAKQMDHPVDPHAEEVLGSMIETPSGLRAFTKDFHRGGPYDLNFTHVSAAFYSELQDWWEEVGRSRFPFFFCFDEDSAPHEVRLVRCLSSFLFPYNPVNRNGQIRLSEEV